MTVGNSLREIERRAWTSFFDDGLWDIFIGLLMLAMGIRTLLDSVLLTSLPFVAVAIFIVGKRMITAARLGHVKFGPMRTARQDKIIAVVVVMVLISFGLMMLTYLRVLLPMAISPVGVFLAFGVGMVFALMGYWMDFRNLYAYAVMFVLSALLWETIGEPAGPIAFTIFGGAVVIVGLATLVRFMRRYPKPSRAE
jgi:hypothetical protein